MSRQMVQTQIRLLPRGAVLSRSALFVSPFASLDKLPYGLASLFELYKVDYSNFFMWQDLNGNSTVEKVSLHFVIIGKTY